MRQQLAERELTVEGPRRQAGEGRRRRSVTVNLAESPLSWLHARGNIDDRLFDAGSGCARITSGRSSARQ